MKKLGSVGIFFLGLLFITPTAHAIVFLPALLLIPIAKIIAVVIAGISFPILGISALSSKLFGKSFKKMLGIGLIILILTAILLVLVLKIQNPARPLF
jgi:hypothetical protein